MCNVLIWSHGSQMNETNILHYLKELLRDKIKSLSVKHAVRMVVSQYYLNEMWWTMKPCILIIMNNPTYGKINLSKRVECLQVKNL